MNNFTKKYEPYIFYSSESKRLEHNYILCLQYTSQGLKGGNVGCSRSMGGSFKDPLRYQRPCEDADDPSITQHGICMKQSAVLWNSHMPGSFSFQCTKQMASQKKHHLSQVLQVHHIFTLQNALAMEVGHSHQIMLP